MDRHLPFRIRRTLRGIFCGLSVIAGAALALALANGNAGAGDGGAILNKGSVFLTNVVTSNSLAEHGGAIANVGRLYASKATLFNNKATLRGGGIYNNRARSL